MSVLIKGMEMPKSCRACPLATRFFDGEDVCAMLGTYVHDRDREDDCPLVPIPPHGDLIDRDAMIRDIQKSLVPSWYIKERNADMVKFLSLEDTIIPADKGGDDDV